MLRDLTIKNYRAFKDFTIDGLAGVNLIVGKNNSGKTSFLEAVYLLANHGSPAALIELLDSREEFTIDVSSDTLQGSIRYHVAHVFHDRDLGVGQERSVRIHSSNETRHNLTLQVRPRTEATIAGLDAPDLELVSTYESATPDVLGRTAGQSSLPLHAGGIFVSDRRYSHPREGDARAQFLTVNPASFEDLADLWDKVIRIPDKESIIVRALRIVEPGIEDLRFTTKRTAGGTFVRLAQQPSRVAVSSQGEGIRRVLALSLSAVMAENSVLLVDEIDTALYHRLQPDVWHLLIETARCFNLQVFATTHSWDAVAAFQQALEGAESGTGRLFRLQERRGDIVPILYEADELAVAVDHAIEVR